MGFKEWVCRGVGAMWWGGSPAQRFRATLPLTAHATRRRREIMVKFTVTNMEIVLPESSKLLCCFV